MIVRWPDSTLEIFIRSFCFWRFSLFVTPLPRPPPFCFFEYAPRLSSASLRCPEKLRPPGAPGASVGARDWDRRGGAPGAGLRGDPGAGASAGLPLQDGAGGWVGWGVGGLEWVLRSFPPFFSQVA